MRSRTGRAALVALLLACSRQTASTGAEPPEAHATPRPVLVLLRHSVWFGAVNQPLFIAYDNGTVIYPDSSVQGIPLSYQTTSLNATGSDSVLARLGIINQELVKLRREYDYAPDVTDQGTVFFFVRQNDSLVRYSVRAGLGNDGQLRPDVPEPLRSIFERLTRFRADNRRPWWPDTLLVSAWAYEYAPDNPPLEWPSGWPDLRSSSTEKRKDPYVDVVYTMRLPSAQRSRLDSLLEARRQTQAIRINGRKWMVSYRMPFPQEQEWRALFGHLEE